MNEHVLFVDDNKFGLRDYQVALERAQFRVTFETKITGARARLESQSFDLLILDIMMPPEDLGPERTEGGDCTGLVFYEEVRKQHAALPIIFFSNVIDELDIDRDEYQQNDQYLKIVDKFVFYPSRLVEMARKLCRTK